MSPHCVEWNPNLQIIYSLLGSSLKTLHMGFCLGAERKQSSSNEWMSIKSYAAMLQGLQSETASAWDVASLLAHSNSAAREFAEELFQNLLLELKDRDAEAAYAEKPEFVVSMQSFDQGQRHYPDGRVPLSIQSSSSQDQRGGAVDAPAAGAETLLEHRITMMVVNAQDAHTRASPLSKIGYLVGVLGFRKEKTKAGAAALKALEDMRKKGKTWVRKKSIHVNSIYFFDRKKCRLSG